MSVAWTITNPGGSGSSPLADLGLSDPQIDFRIMGISKARILSNRDYDSEEPWWASDEVVTIYRDAQPFYTGRVQECAKGATPESEHRILRLADAWQDLEEVTYQEPWSTGGDSVLFPRCILGRNASGVDIKTGAQIEEVIDFAISQGVEIDKGTIDEGLQLWPSESRNTSCEAIVIGELRFHPDWACYLDHTTTPPTFHARAKASLDTVTIDIADEKVENFDFSEVVRNVPLGVRIVWESAATVDGEVYRSAYIEAAGNTSGRRVMAAMLELEGMAMQTQKSRIKTRDIPEEGNNAEAYILQKNFLKANFPKLAELPLDSWGVKNFKTTLVPDAGGHPPAISALAPRLIPDNKSDIPRQLVTGQIEDWMRKKVGQINVSYDFLINPAVGPADRPKLERYEGKDLDFTVTATNATTRRYKGISSFTAGEGRPEGLAAAIFAAATEQQHEGFVRTVAEDCSAGRFHGKKIVLMDGSTVIMPATVIHSASFDIERGAMTLDFGPLPFLTAGDLLELQRLFNRRKPTWMTPEERTSNTIGDESKASAKGDTVSGYEQPQTVVPPGGEVLRRMWKATKATDTTIDCTGGTLTGQAGFAAVPVADATALSATASGHVSLTINRDSSTRAITGTPAITYAAGTLTASDYNAQIIPLAKVTVTSGEITEIMPLKFEELHIFESLAKVNGESMLVSLDMLPRGIYSPPPP